MSGDLFCVWNDEHHLDATRISTIDFLSKKMHSLTSLSQFNLISEIKSYLGPKGLGEIIDLGGKKNFWLVARLLINCPQIDVVTNTNGLLLLLMLDL